MRWATRSRNDRRCFFVDPRRFGRSLAQQFRVLFFGADAAHIFKTLTGFCLDRTAAAFDDPPFVAATFVSAVLVELNWNWNLFVVVGGVSAADFFFGSGCTGAHFQVLVLYQRLAVPQVTFCVFVARHAIAFVVTHEFAIERPTVVLTLDGAKIIPVEYKVTSDNLISCVCFENWKVVSLNRSLESSWQAESTTIAYCSINQNNQSNQQSNRQQSSVNRSAFFP
jgi:hypothetical protein